MYLIKNVKIPLDSDFSDLKNLFCGLYKINKKDIDSIALYKKSVDARKKDDVRFTCSFIIEVKKIEKLYHKINKSNICKYTEEKYVYQKAECRSRPVVVGFGPAGMFSALSLARSSLKPIVIERGKDVDSRIEDVNKFITDNILNEESNVQFGEGGAGTFSDGKLNTGINDTRIREVLKIFVSHGAPENILYDAKPHIGTDILVRVVKSIRNEIISLGGEILFEHKLVDIQINNFQVQGIIAKTPYETKKIECRNLVLALGHSARDTFIMLKEAGFKIEPKSFAVGVRIEHSQNDINKAQYGKFAEHLSLGAADYKLSTHLENGRSVFTFCMCPGGVVVNASSEENGVVINGMSYSKRNGTNANSAVLVNINVEDYYKNDVLDGINFQKSIENKAFEIGKGYPVVQSFGNFKNLRTQKIKGGISPSVKTKYTIEDINSIFPKFISESLKEGITQFGKKIKGFDSDDAILTAPETRSSSPVRILRGDHAQANISGVYPCGEGAGYAGGIMSAAVDGLKTAEMIVTKINKPVTE